MVRLSNSLPTIIEKPDLETQGPGNGSPGWIVTVYDNDHNTVEEVILILIKATACSLDEAKMETWEIHHLGKSVVHHGEADECGNVAAVIAQIGIRVEISAE
jgi:ATP-dependent Clp protease adapter protein ClpS